MLLNPQDAQRVEQILELGKDADPNQWPRTLGEENGARRWVAICKEVAERAPKHHQRIQLLAAIEELNGFRRIPDVNLTVLEEKMKHLQRWIERIIADDLEDRRAQELIAYHAGIVYQMTGNFGAAMEAHYQTAKFADGMLGRQIAMYQAGLCLMEAALLDSVFPGADPNRVEQALEKFGEVAEGLFVLAQGFPSENGKRWEANACAMLAHYSFLAGGETKREHALNWANLAMKRIGQLPTTAMKGEFEPCRRYLFALKQYLCEQVDKAFNTAADVPSTSREHYPYARLLQARISAEEGEVQTAAEIFTAVKRMKTAYVASALASRELCQLENEETEA